MPYIDHSIDSIEKLINFKVRIVRSKLTSCNTSSNKNLTGLCYEATEMFINEMTKSCEKRGYSFKARHIHGEQKHNPRIKSENWIYQHDWCWVEVRGKRYYVDCTSGQFKWMYKDIPDFYISMKKPKWYYDDRRNPAFNWFTKWLNNKIVISKTIFIDDELRTVHEGIIEILQYDVWGSISDFIRKIIGGKTSGKKQK